MNGRGFKGRRQTADGKRQTAKKNKNTVHVAPKNKIGQPGKRLPAFAINIDCSKFVRPCLPCAVCRLPCHSTTFCNSY
jgi:hypothetical protein